jgi:hypothetical protein
MRYLYSGRQGARIRNSHLLESKRRASWSLLPEKLDTSVLRAVPNSNTRDVNVPSI